MPCIFVFVFALKDTKQQSNDGVRTDSELQKDFGFAIHSAP